MNSVILRTASYYLLPLLLLFSIFVLLRGHYEPGGGFVGGLVASIAFVLHAFANGLDNTKAFLQFHPGVLIPIGLAVALISGLTPMLFDFPFMKSIWLPEPLPVVSWVGTALFFDIGVYIVVIGVTLTILFTISEATAD
jgi:multicomponent Na+:H+ antiporter subunit B